VLLLLFFASGFAGLVYEVCWVRGFGNEFGNTVHSASLVAAVFMAGLGLGSYRAGAWADRRSRAPAAARTLLRAYGAAELGVGVLGVALALALPRLGWLSTSISTYARDAHGWYVLSAASHALRYAIAAALVLPPSFLMGATLTLLVRATLLRDLSRAGLQIGLLYGANTAGAALGAYATDVWLVPRLGIFGAQGAAAAVNVLVAVGAVALARRAHVEAAREGGASEASPSEAASVDADAGASGAGARDARRVLVAGCVALGLSGFAALGMEIVWFRFLSATLGAYRSVFALVLTAVLAGICVGSAAGGYCQRRWGRALELFVAAQALFAVSALGLMATFTTARGAPHAVALPTVLVVVGAPSLLMGFSFPLVNAQVHDALSAVGRRAGALYLANTVGSVLGSLVSGFWLAPGIGSQASFAVLAALAAVAPMPLVAVALRRGESPAARALKGVAIVAAGLTVVSVAAYGALGRDHLTRRFVPALPPPDHVLASYEGAEGTIHVLDVGEHGRLLFTNGHPMSGTSLGSQRYMRAFSHLPLLMMERPERALVICFGVGSTLHATSLHPSLTGIDLADLSRGVLSHASYFRDNNHDVLSDPRVSVYVEDGRQHLRGQAPGTYDLVTLEPPPIEFAGISALYSREFYDLARSRLTPRGIITQWLPAYAVPPDVGLAMVRAFVEAFPSSVLLSGYGPELILMGSASPGLTLDLDRVEAELRARPEVAADLARVQLGSLTDLAATFVAGADALRRATGGVAPVTDDKPQMEYTFGRPSELSPALFGHSAGVRDFCPKCFDDGAPSARVADLPARLAILERLYATRRFRKNQQPFAAIAEGAEERAVVRRSDYLSAILAGGAEARFARGYALAQRGQLGAAERELLAGLARAPSDAEAHYNLAVIYASTRREDLAVAEAQRAIECGNGEHPRARKMLCALRGDGCAPSADVDAGADASALDAGP
jgi:spermidine synthase